MVCLDGFIVKKIAQKLIGPRLLMFSYVYRRVFVVVEGPEQRVVVGNVFLRIK